MLEKIFITIVFIIFGAVFGSFACCQAWRIWYKENRKERLGKRSVCLKCKKPLRWYENIPIVSWTLQGGKCRGCGKDIGKMEILSEVAGAVMFGLLGLKVMFFEATIGGGDLIWSYFITGILVVFFVIALILAIYDAKWRELPTFLLILLIIFGACVLCVSLFVSFREGLDIKQELLDTLGSVGILGGIYYLLYFLSREKLVGGGDWMLGLGIGLVLQSWWLAVWVLMLANVAGAVVMIPQKKKQIAFGPFLVGAFVVVYAFSGVFLGMM